jgi:hypothetical protein
VLAASLVAFVDTSPGRSVTDGEAGVELADGSATSPDEDETGAAKTKGPSDPADEDGTTTTSAPSSDPADGPTAPGAADPDEPSAPPPAGSADGSEDDPGTGAPAPTTAPPPTAAAPSDDVSTTPVGGTKDGSNQMSDERQAPSITGFVATRVSGTCSDARQVMTKFEWSSTNGTSASVGPQSGATIGVDPTSHLLTCAVRKSTWVLTVSGPGGTTSATTPAPA